MLTEEQKTSEFVFSFLGGCVLSLFILLLYGAALMQVGCLIYKSYAVCFLTAGTIYAGFWIFRKKYQQWQNGRSIISDCREENDISSDLGKRGLSDSSVCAILALLCFIVNASWIIFFQIEPSVDFAYFWNYAQRLTKETVAKDTYVAMFPHIFGYSWFLSFFVRLFGPSKMLAPIINVCFTTISCVSLFAIAITVFSRREAVLSCLLWIFLPSKTIYNAMVLTEPFYTCGVLTFCAVCSRIFMTKCKPIVGVISGCCCAFLLSGVNAVRPVALIVIIAFLIWLFFLRSVAQRHNNPKNTVLSFTVTLLALYFVIGKCWNTYAENRIGMELSSYPGYNICVGVNTDTGGSYSQDDMDEVFGYCYCGKTVPEAQHLMLEKAVERLHSGKYNISFFLEKLRKFIGCDEGGAYYALEALTEKQYSFLCLISNVYYYFLLFLTTEGSIVLIRKKQGNTALILPLYAIGLTLAHMIVEVAGRYHYSVLPAMVLVAGTVAGEENKIQKICKLMNRK